MQELNFTIRKIRHGWFVCSFGEVELWASDCCCHDGPRQLLRLLAEVFSGEREAGYAVFETEPGSWILSIRSGERNTLALWYSKMNLFDWYPEGVGDHMVLSKLPRHLKLEERLLSIEELDLYQLACSVDDAFSEYLPTNMRDSYVKNWMPFPTEELVELRHALGDYTGSL